MNVLDASNRVFEWFSKQECIFLSSKAQKDDFQGVMVISDNHERDRACLVAALEDYEKGDIVKKSPSKDGVYWFLKKPFQSYDQTVPIDSQTALHVAGVINKFCEKVNDKTDVCDPLKIIGKDIKNLVLIVMHMTSVGEQQDKTD